MKKIIKWFICSGCGIKINISFLQNETEKQVKCSHCGKYSIIKK